MRRLRWAVVASLMVLVTGCGSTVEPASSGAEFARLAGHGTDVSFASMGGPGEALGVYDLIVRGTVKDIFEGIEYRYDDGRPDRLVPAHATFVVSVEEVLAGDRSLVLEGRVYLQVLRNRQTSVDDLAAANPEPAVLLLMTDISDQLPDPGATVVRPDRLPADAPLLWADPDGLWLQTANDDEMVGIYADHDELDPAWGRPRTLDEMAEVIVRCRDGDCP